MNKLKSIIQKQGIEGTLPAIALPAVSPDRLAQGVIVIAILAAASLFLMPAPLEFPIDDTYIHFVYAENLVEHGALFFNTPDEIGVGTSSLLWVLILAAGNWAGLSLHWVAKLSGVVSLAVMGVGLYYLLRPFVPSWAALAGTLLVVLSGHMLWFALSGMETVLFLALGVLSLLCYREERWAWLGISLGLLIVTRVEGVILALVIGVFDVWRYRKVRLGLLTAALASLLICGPWFLYLWRRTGSFLPTSGIGRHLSNIAAIKIASERIESLTWLSRFPALAYPLFWIGYTIEFVLGGFALPPPYLYINVAVGSFSYKLSIWAIIGLVGVILPLLWVSLARLPKFLRTPGWCMDKARLPLVIFLAWAILHNLSYMAYLPIIGSASRYAAINHILLWLALGMGVWFLRKKPYKLWLVGGLLAIGLANTAYWNRVYDANLEHMLGVRIAAADYIRERVPATELCAAADVGALRYYMGRPLVDLGGLIDPTLIEWYLAGEFDQYLVENGVTCLALPGRMGTTTDGVIDIAREMGFSQSSLFDLHPVEVFQIDRQRWLEGYLPTINYQATVTVYELVE